MGYPDLVKTRLHISISEEEGETNKAIRARGEQYVVDDAESLINGLEKSLLSVLKELREESKNLPPAAFSELWSAVRVHFNEQLLFEARQRKITLKSRYQQRGRYTTSDELALGQYFDQRISNLRNAINHRIEECAKSYELIFVPSRQTTKNLLALVEEVDNLLKAHGDVSVFVRQNSAQLDRIEAELKRLGLDIAYAADALASSEGNKRASKGTIAQFIGGISTNAAYDGIKIALTALSSIAS
jgi:hypothetical protein